MVLLVMSVVSAIMSSCGHHVSIYGSRSKPGGMDQARVRQFDPYPDPYPMDHALGSDQPPDPYPPDPYL